MRKQIRIPRSLPFALTLLYAALACRVAAEKSTDTSTVDTSRALNAQPPIRNNRDPGIARAESVRAAQIAKGDTMRFAGQTLSELGIGPLRIGMTVAEADSALGGGFADSDIGNPPMCTQAVLTKAPPGFNVELESGKVAAIVVESGSIGTSTGIHLGDQEA